MGLQFQTITVARSPRVSLRPTAASTKQYRTPPRGTTVSRPILFVTTTFDTITNGPGVYSQNLWRLFSSGDEFNFHVVALHSSISHPRMHIAAHHRHSGSASVYSSIESMTQLTLNQLGASTILHLNMAHILSPSLVARYTTIAQVNDVEVCTWRPSIEKIVRYGMRRNLTLAWRRRRERAITQSAANVICNSEFTSRTVSQSYGLVPSRVRTIYKAVDLAPMMAAAKNFSAQGVPTPPILIFVGSNWALKGLDVLLKALQILAARGVGFTCAVYGDPDALSRRRFARLASVLGISHSVEFAGILDRSRLPTTLASASLLVLPSREEALGLVAIEALACGIPVVASNVGGVPEVVRGDTCGQLFPCGDTHALANAIQRVLGTRPSEVVRQARVESVQRFSLPRLEANIRALYQSFL